MPSQEIHVPCRKTDLKHTFVEQECGNTTSWMSPSTDVSQGLGGKAYGVKQSKSVTFKDC